MAENLKLDNNLTFFTLYLVKVQFVHFKIFHKSFFFPIPNYGLMYAWG